MLGAKAFVTEEESRKKRGEKRYTYSPPKSEKELKGTPPPNMSGPGVLGPPPQGRSSGAEPKLTRWSQWSPHHAANPPGSGTQKDMESRSTEATGEALEVKMTSLSSRSKPVRVSHSLCEEEKEAVQQRNIKIQRSLQEMGIPCDMAYVPPIAVLGSGGGLRAMVALMGTLSEMKTQNLLDSILYLCGVSGSTWCMSALYKNKDWSSQVEEREEEMVEMLTTGTVSVWKKWKRIFKDVDDENYSLTDLWTGIIVYHIVKEENKEHLSSCTDETMVNPYPIFAAIDNRRWVNKAQHEKVWFEITRHEAGYPAYGAFVETSVFGSHFKAGEHTEKKEEMDMLYLQGLCGSAIGDMRENIKCIIEWIIHHIFSDAEVIMDITLSSQKGDHCGCKHCTKVLLLFDLHVAFHSEEDCKPILRKLMATQEGEEYRQLQKIHKTWEMQNREEQEMHISEVTEIILVSINEKMFNLLKKMLNLVINWTWGTKFNFLYQFPNTGLPSDLVQDEKIHLIDAGLSNNCGYPLVLRPERQVQIILSFDFSTGDPFKTVRQAAEYSKKNNIPFPFIPAVSEKEKACPSDCYIYRGKNTPTVMHFPLFNKVNCGDAEKIKEMWKIYGTTKTSFTEEEIQGLLAASKKNVRNNQDKIIAEIKKAVKAQ
ncbi:cytosolic phospholipase A2 gamma [Amia ocellicauda]|uniref:cytosolic phospholipase A2 gamma n=1 Tax=Amia ocellicauda TaxID=2972642 RepID=UPI003463C544